MESLITEKGDILILIPEDFNKNWDLRFLRFTTCYYPKSCKNKIEYFIKRNLVCFGFTLDDLYTEFIQYEKRRTY